MRARRLTEADYIKSKGIIDTLEGPGAFQPGDYLAVDRKGSWPIKRENVESLKLGTGYMRITAHDEHGFAYYRVNEVRLATRMNDTFTEDDLHGSGYLVRPAIDKPGWPVDHEIFEETYRQILSAKELAGADYKDAADRK